MAKPDLPRLKQKQSCWSQLEKLMSTQWLFQGAPSMPPPPLLRHSHLSSASRCMSPDRLCQWSSFCDVRHRRIQASRPLCIQSQRSCDSVHQRWLHTALNSLNTPDGDKVAGSCKACSPHTWIFGISVEAACQSPRLAANNSIEGEPVLHVPAGKLRKILITLSNVKHRWSTSGLILPAHAVVKRETGTGLVAR